MSDDNDIPVDDEDDLPVQTEPQNLINYYASLATVSHDEVRRLASLSVALASGAVKGEALQLARLVELFLNGTMNRIEAQASTSDGKVVPLFPSTH